MSEVRLELAMKETAATGQSAADQQFGEAVQPTEPAGLAQRNVLRMDRPALGTAPAKQQIANEDALQAQSAGRDQRRTQLGRQLDMQQLDTGADTVFKQFRAQAAGICDAWFNRDRVHARVF